MAVGLAAFVAVRCNGTVWVRSLTHGVTSAVRRPDSSEWNTQPSSPSLSRMRRQLSNSATISTGRPSR